MVLPIDVKLDERRKGPSTTCSFIYQYILYAIRS